MKPLYILGILALTLIGCTGSENKITATQDYETYLDVSPEDEVITLRKELDFWNKRIKEDSLQLVDLTKVGNIQTSLFKATGDIIHLKKAEKAYMRAEQAAAVGKDNYQMTLAHNYISQHRFRDAHALLKEANAISGGTKAVEKMMFDVTMELGDYKAAQVHLESIKDNSDFDYLIRKAKWNDYAGNLDATIHYMEQAKGIADESNVASLQVWTYTNLADYYGHAGRIKDSYAHYLKTLELDPSNAYAKKGIAWIVFSKERNPKEARRILSSIQKHYQSPDYHLLQSEIAAYEGDEATEKKELDLFMAAVKNPVYGNMYRAYTTPILAQSGDKIAIELAQQEVDERPTPMSYDLLAHSLLLNGEKEKALEIAQKNIVGKTYEPVAQLHLAQIYKANGFEGKAQALKKELLEASYELGPVTYKEVENI